jgi:phosphonate transport system substrate-binding protein
LFKVISTDPFKTIESCSMKFRVLLVLTLFLASCVPLPSVKADGYVDLTNRQPLPTPANSQTAPLRVAVAAVISPQGTIESYTALLEYLGRKLQRPIELVQRRTYLEVNDLVQKGEVDVAFVCTSAYVAGHDLFGMQLLAAPQVEGETVYYSLLIVPASSTAQSMADLKDKVFAFTDPISLSGRMYPTSLVQQLGSTPESFFSRTFFTYSHDDAIQAVANRVADGAAVDSLVYEFAIARNPSLAEKVRVIHRSPPFGIPPVVVGPSIRPQLMSDLQVSLLELHQDPEGRDALRAIGIDRFVLIDDNAYTDVRTLLSNVNATR